MDLYNFENDNDCVNYIRNNSILPFFPEDNIAFKKVYTFKQKKLLIVNHRLSFDKFSSIKKGYGGRVGIVPYTLLNNEPQFFIGYSSANLFSDFGGGVKSHETPIEGLERELSEECCDEWKNYFINKIKSRKQDEKDVIFCNEYLFLDKPNHEKKGTRYQIIILCYIDEKTAYSFKTTSETINCDLYNKEKLKRMLYKPCKKWEYINSGLVQLRDNYNQLVECM